MKNFYQDMTPKFNFRVFHVSEHPRSEEFDTETGSWFFAPTKDCYPWYPSPGPQWSEGYPTREEALIEGKGQERIQEEKHSYE